MLIFVLLKAMATCDIVLFWHATRRVLKHIEFIEKVVACLTNYLSVLCYLHTNPIGIVFGSDTMELPVNVFICHILYLFLGFKVT